MARKTKKTYRAAPGAQYSHRKAAVIGAELEKLGQSVTPLAVVVAATPTKSPLHDQFEWDDSVAAQSYRVFQARQLINHLQVVVVQASGESAAMKAYFSQVVESEDEDANLIKERKYLSVELVASSPVSAGNAIQQAKAELLSWKSRYERYREFFAAVFEAADNLPKSRRKAS